MPAGAAAVVAAAGATMLLLLAGADHDGASAAGAASAALDRAPVQIRLQRMLGRLVRSHRSFPGAAAAVTTPRMAWVGAAGVADRTTHRRLTPDATFRIASVTKTFTAAAILRLVEAGKLALDAPIARHLSRRSARLLRDGGYDVDNIRVRHLLQHTSGLAGDYSQLEAYLEFVLAHPRHRWTRAEQIRFVMTHSKPLAAPGAEYHYSDTGYVLLGEVLARVTGRHLAAAYRSVLHLGRLGLDETYLETREPKPPAAKRRAHQYLGRLDTTGFDPSFDLHGAGGLVSTVDDLARFYRALVSGRVFKRARTLRTMLSNGMGIEEARIGGETCFGHGGFWGDAAYHCPRSGLTIATMINQAQGFIRPTAGLLEEMHRLLAPKPSAAEASPLRVVALAPPRGLRDPRTISEPYRDLPGGSGSGSPAIAARPTGRGCCWPAPTPARGSSSRSSSPRDGTAARNSAPRTRPIPGRARASSATTSDGRGSGQGLGRLRASRRPPPITEPRLRRHAQHRLTRVRLSEPLEQAQTVAVLLTARRTSPHRWL